MKKFSFFEKFILPFSVLVFVAALCASLAPYISPQKTWIVAFFGLGFLIFYVLNFFFLIFWMIKRKKIFLLHLLAFLTGIAKVPSVVQLRFPGKAVVEEHKTTLKIMSFNARSFDLYNWLGNWTGKSKVREQIFKMIKKESPDVICFQEFYTSDSGKFHTTKILMEDIGMKYSHVVLTVNLHGTDHFGMAIFSRYPLTNKGVIDFNRKGSNLCLYADLIANNDTIRMYDCHLQSIRFKQEDYRLMNQISYNIEEENVTGFKKIFTRLKIAFTKRALQADTVATHISASPHPVILCGDFNDSPTSYSYHAICNNLSDAFRESGNGFGNTYVGPFPAFRIDYIFHSPEIQSYGYKTIYQKLSDHYPIVCNVVLGEKNLRTDN